MNVKEVSTQLGIPVSTLHYYEKMELLKPQRKDNNYRDYTEKDLIQLKMIYLLKEFHFNIQEVKQVLDWNRDQVDFRSKEAEARDFFKTKKEQLQQQILFIEYVIKIIDQLPLFSTTAPEYSQKQKIVTELIELLYRQYQEEIS